MRRYLPLAVLALTLVAVPALALEGGIDTPQSVATRLSLCERVVIALTGIWEKYLGMGEPFGDESVGPDSASLPQAEAVPTLDAEVENSTGS